MWFKRRSRAWRSIFSWHRQDFPDIKTRLICFLISKLETDCLECSAELQHERFWIFHRVGAVSASEKHVVTQRNFCCSETNLPINKWLCDSHPPSYHRLPADCGVGLRAHFVTHLFQLQQLKVAHLNSGTFSLSTRMGASWCQFRGWFIYARVYTVRMIEGWGRCVQNGGSIFKHGGAFFRQLTSATKATVATEASGLWGFFSETFRCCLYAHIKTEMLLILFSARWERQVCECVCVWW